MDMAVLVNTLWKNEVDFTASNHVIQYQNFGTQTGYKTKNKNYYKWYNTINLNPPKNKGPN